MPARRLKLPYPTNLARRTPRPAEPTTGLDSAAAVAVVNLLHRTAVDSGLTIISSIHQPCSAVWAAFDQVSLLARGLLLYFGPCGKVGGLLVWGPGLGG
jgi:ABC-type cobalamin transport system ATPase subunit